METVIKELDALLLRLRENEIVAIDHRTIARWRMELENTKQRIKLVVDN